LDPGTLTPANDVQTVVPAGSTWSYLYNADGPSGAWTGVNYDASSWASGAAPIGWGQASLGTTLTTNLATKPLTSFYRKTFQVADMTKVVKLGITTRADDGVAVYVNGTEVKRVNMDPGPDGVNVYANLAVSASAALANPVVFDVPGDLLVNGTNVITASVHSNYRTTPSHSFELEAIATLSGD
ncbi:MAG: galactose oxidase, partial [Actinobacteria bacterium]|nr:galactose oxidase [Actinomycetota bacterium]